MSKNERYCINGFPFRDPISDLRKLFSQFANKKENVAVGFTGGIEDNKRYIEITLKNIWTTKLIKTLKLDYNDNTEPSPIKIEQILRELNIVECEYRNIDIDFNIKAKSNSNNEIEVLKLLCSGKNDFSIEINLIKSTNYFDIKIINKDEVYLLSDTDEKINKLAKKLNLNNDNTYLELFYMSKNDDLYRVYLFRYFIENIKPGYIDAISKLIDKITLTNSCILPSQDDYISHFRQSFVDKLKDNKISISIISKPFLFSDFKQCFNFS